MVQDRAILTKFLTHIVCAESHAKNGFLAIFDGLLEILRKMQKCIYLGNGARFRDFEVFDLQGIHRVICNFLPTIVFPPFFVAILNYCVKHKNIFISEMVQDRAISILLVMLGV